MNHAIDHVLTGDVPETAPDPVTEVITYDCPDCEDTGTSELRDVRGVPIAVSYCSCDRGALLRYQDDHAAADVLKTANDTLTAVSWDTLQRLRVGLLALLMADPS